MTSYRSPISWFAYAWDCQSDATLSERRTGYQERRSIHQECFGIQDRSVRTVSLPDPRLKYTGSEIDAVSGRGDTAGERYVDMGKKGHKGN